MILAGAEARLTRAQEHLADMRERRDLARQDHLNRLSVEQDAEKPNILKVSGPRTISPPLVLSVTVGEHLYNLRAALDYLIYELALLDSGEPKTGTQFPIESTPEGFAGRRNTYLKGVSDEHVALIETLQPYRGCEWTKRLKVLSNPDKHRHLLSIAHESEARFTVRKGEFGEFDDVGTGAVFRTEVGPHPGDVHVEIDATFLVTFEDETVVVDELEVLQSQVSELLQAFKTELEG